MRAGNFVIGKFYEKHNFIIKNFGYVILLHLFKIDSFYFHRKKVIINLCVYL